MGVSCFSAALEYPIPLVFRKRSAMRLLTGHFTS